MTTWRGGSFEPCFGERRLKGGLPSIMTDRKIFDLFYGARENDLDMCRRAYETGADINFAFDGRRSTKGGAGRWYACYIHV